MKIDHVIVWQLQSARYRMIVVNEGAQC